MSAKLFKNNQIHEEFRNRLPLSLLAARLRVYSRGICDDGEDCYERSVIIIWLAGSDTGNLTNEPIKCSIQVKIKIRLLSTKKLSLFQKSVFYIIWFNPYVLFWTFFTLRFKLKKIVRNNNESIFTAQKIMQLVLLDSKPLYKRKLTLTDKQKVYVKFRCWSKICLCFVLLSL